MSHEPSPSVPPIMVNLLAAEPTAADEAASCKVEPMYFEPQRLFTGVAHRMGDTDSVAANRPMRRLSAQAKRWLKVARPEMYRLDVNECAVNLESLD